ncbi:MAG: hypothetical protein R3Y35_12385 [Clostridia bacterium]
MKLKQLYYLELEIAEIKNQICNLKDLATSTTSILSDMPAGTDTSDKVGKCVAAIIDLQQELVDLTARRVAELESLNDFIAAIEDSQLRTIFYLRYVKHLTWLQIAFKTGYTDEQRPRRLHNKYLLSKKGL